MTKHAQPFKKTQAWGLLWTDNFTHFFLKKNDVLSTMANETSSINLVYDDQQGGWKIKQGFFGSKH